MGAEKINTVEPWLRGTRMESPAVVRGVLHAFDLAREDVQKACKDLTADELHGSPLGLTPLAYHLRHIPRSLDRLLTYAEGGLLTETQLGLLRAEQDAGTTSEALLREFFLGLDAAEARVKALANLDMEAWRGVGRKALPTTVGGLLVHLADHTQRHAGQVVTTAKVIRALRGAGSGPA